jgi:hypothetical protein
LHEDSDSFGVESSIFPFLSVLFCSIGAMTLIMGVGSAMSSMKDPERAVAIAKEETEQTELDAEKAKQEAAHKELKDEEEVLKQGITRTGAIASLRKSAEAAKRTAATKLAKVSALRRDLAQARETPERIATLGRRRQADAALAKAQEARDEASTAATETGREREKLLSDLEAVEAEVSSSETRVSVAGEETGKKPVFVELQRDHLIVHTAGASIPAGTRIEGPEATGDGGAMEKLARALALPDAEGYAIFLVRPGAVGLFEEARLRFRRWRAPFGREPVDAEWRLVFE